MNVHDLIIALSHFPLDTEVVVGYITDGSEIGAEVQAHINEVQQPERDGHAVIITED